MRKLFFIGLACFLSSACTVKTLYNQLDWLIVDRLQSYVELDEEQQELLYANVQQTLIWHRSTQLPLYVKYLQAFKADVLGTPTEKGIGQNLDQFQLFMAAIRAHSANQMAELLPLLSAEQKQQIYKKMADENVKFSEKFIEIDRAEQVDVYADRIRSRLDDWLGSVNDKQEALVEDSAKQIQPVAKEVLETRKRWQAEFRDIMENTRNSKRIASRLQDLLVNIEKQRSPNYRRIFAANRRVVIKLIIDISRTMDKEQRQHMTEKVDDYSQNFTELAREANAKIPGHPL